MDTHLNTGVQEYNISVGQVFTCDLKCQEVLDDLIKIHVLSLADPSEPEVKPFPVFYPKPVYSVLLSNTGEPLPLSNLNPELE